MARTEVTTSYTYIKEHNLQDQETSVRFFGQQVAASNITPSDEVTYFNLKNS